MPIKLNVSVSKKVGQPDFGSLGASCSVEVELPHNIVFDDLEAFHRHARNVYVAATQAVNDELARHAGNAGASNGNGNTAGNGHAAPSGNGHTNGRTNGCANGNGKAKSNGRKATESQLRAIRAIANRLGLDLASTLEERFGIDHPEDLAIGQASELIDSLKAETSGGQR
jgi:hypothetical protein